LVVETTAAATIALYLAVLFVAGEWNQKATAPGVFHSTMTGMRRHRHGIRLLFQRGAPMSALPAVFAPEPRCWRSPGLRSSATTQPSRLLGILSIVALCLLRAADAIAKPV
jgi:hypothetical protein